MGGLQLGAGVPRYIQRPSRLGSGPSFGATLTCTVARITFYLLQSDDADAKVEADAEAEADAP